MVNIPLFTGFYTSQVVQNFSHQQYCPFKEFFGPSIFTNLLSTASAGNLNDKVPHPSPHHRSQTHANHFDFPWIWHGRHAFWGNLIFTTLYSRSPCYQLGAGRKLLSENGLKYDLWTPQVPRNHCDSGHESNGAVEQDFRRWRNHALSAGKLTNNYLVTTETFCVV